VIYTGLLFAASSSLRPLPDAGEALLLASVLLMIALASLSSGALVGFLFGVPRLVGSSVRTDDRTYADNTNLEQVADWLTKILIGFGLAQLANIPPALGQLSSVTSDALGEGAAGAPLVGSTVVFFVSVGFLYGYLWSRIQMIQALEEGKSALDRLRSEVHVSLHRRRRSNGQLRVASHLHAGHSPSGPRAGLDARPGADGVAGRPPVFDWHRSPGSSIEFEMTSDEGADYIVIW